MFWWESQNERDHLEDQGIDERMGSECILREIGWGGGELDSTGSEYEPVAGCVSAVMNLRVLAPRSVVKNFFVVPLKLRRLCGHYGRLKMRPRALTT
jgi:hypothetical protein